MDDGVFGLPDDGIGSLPRLRHLVLKDEKSSTYKIALLRILARLHHLNEVLR